MFKELANRPAYIFKFAIYLLFISFAFIFYFSNILEQQDKNLKLVYSLLLLLYGSYRLVRSYQDFRKDIRADQNEF